MLLFGAARTGTVEITVDQMYAIEEKGHRMGFLKKFMMENAGAAAVRRLVGEFGGDVASKRVLVLAGMGNNGGDGLVMARHLAGHGCADVRVVLLGEAGGLKTEESFYTFQYAHQHAHQPAHKYPDIDTYSAGTKRPAAFLSDFEAGKSVV